MLPPSWGGALTRAGLLSSRQQVGDLKPRGWEGSEAESGEGSWWAPWGKDHEKRLPLGGRFGTSSRGPRAVRYFAEIMGH